MKYKNISKITSGILLCTVLTCNTPIYAFTKDETVYSKLSVTGKRYNDSIVNTHIKNKENINLIDDISNLLNIKNVNGEENLKQDGNNLVWNSNGSDVYYQGDTSKELPIECKIKYELDGKEITADELVGKNGKVKVTLEYLNKDSHIEKINGKYETMYTPFVVVCGTILSNDKNKNIEISSGKVIDDGSKTTVLGMCLPGMKESLNLSKEDVKIPEKVEITMDVTDFELNNIITFVTPKVIEKDDLEIFDKIDKLYSNVDTLQNSSLMLKDGANTLKNGTSEYTQKSQEFNNAIKQFSNGINSANQNYIKIDDAVKLLNENTKVLQSGAKTVNDGTNLISSNLKEVNKNVEKLCLGANSLYEGQIAALQGLDNILLGINNIQISDNSGKITKLRELNSKNEALVTALKASDPVQNSQVIALLEANMAANLETIKTLEKTDMSQINNLIGGLNSLKQGMIQVKDGTKDLIDGTSALSSGTKILSEKSEELASGINTLYQGTIKLSDGINTLNAGSTQMKNGLGTLDVSSNAISQATNQLTEGASTISDGAKSLAEGVTKFNDDGIESICNFINSDVKDISCRLEKLQELSNKYNNFTMLNKENEGNVKFIMITDSIKKNK